MRDFRYGAVDELQGLVRRGLPQRIRVLMHGGQPGARCEWDIVESHQRQIPRNRQPGATGFDQDGQRRIVGDAAQRCRAFSVRYHESRQCLRGKMPITMHLQH